MVRTNPEEGRLPDDTLIQALERSLAAETKASNGMAAPVAILWTDPERQWLPLAAVLRPILPNFFTLGDWNPASRTGPTIWLKCIVDRTIDDAPPPELTPILYLPGVGRQTLRLGHECPAALQPLIELQFRGTVWHQKNGRDWTVEAFLLSELDLDIAQDAKTREAMLRALPLLADAALQSLRGRRLDADDFDLLAVNDPIRDLLRWMGDPEEFRTGVEENQWEAFRSLMKGEFDFDPGKSDALEAAERLLEGKGRWNEAWQRFAEAPQIHPRIGMRLRETPPPKSLLYTDRDPRHNENRESELRKALEECPDRAHADLCQKILALEEQHGRRRGLVWSRLGESPLALAMEPLARLARLAAMPIGGSSVESIANEYTSKGWSCDRALLDVLALARGSDGDLVARVARALYAPWADASARNFQKLIGTEGHRDQVEETPAEPESCSLFVDGLRFDLGMMLQEKLDGRGMKTSVRHRLAPLPTVTATGKPIATPHRAMFVAGDDSSGFNPVIASTGQPIVASRLRDELARAGVIVMNAEETMSPGSEDAIGWSEAAEIDSLGHKLGVGLAKQLDDELERIADRVGALVDAGWRVKVVTDHGWLLLPAGLPKVDLPKSVVETKWSRCAAVQAGATPDVTTYPWSWNPGVRIASPPGIGAYFSGQEYSHGGVSLQECVIPELIVERPAPTVIAKITRIEWRGMRCRVAVDTNDPRARIDLRFHWNRPEQDLVASTKPIGTEGEASLVVQDDRNEGKAAVVVVVGSSGMVLDYQATTIGEER